MNGAADHLSHEAISERLPWFVNGTLPDAARAAVEAHLEVCAACREDLRLCEEMAQSVRSGRTIPIPPCASADDLLQRAQRATRSRRSIDWRIAASIAVIAAAGLVLVSQIRQASPPNQEFTTVTQRTTVATVDYVFEVRLAGRLDDAARARVLGQLGGSTSAVETDDSTYHLTLSLPPQSLTQHDAIATDMAAMSEVVSADVVALQVPVR